MPSYCLVTETAATVYGGVKAIAMREGTLRIQLTRAAAKTLDVATKLTIALNVDSPADDLRNGIRQVFSYGTGREPSPELDLE
jgi:hypothetical protein